MCEHQTNFFDYFKIYDIPRSKKLVYSKPFMKKNDILFLVVREC